MVLKNADTEYSPRISPRNWLLPVLNNQTTPPTTPNDGDRYRVTATATGLWTGKENNIAIWNKDDQVWVFQPLVEPQIWYDMTSQNWHYMSHTGVITQFDKIPLAISDVTGLQAALDGKAPLVHKANHVVSGSDPFVAGDILDATAKSIILKNGAAVSTRRGINLIEGANITLSISDDSADERANITINSVGGGASFFDSLFKIENATDNTKILTVDASGIPTTTTITVKPPAANGTLATLENAETISGAKTFSQTITSSKNGDVLLPSTDGQGNVGNASKRFALVRAVAVTTGDLVLSDRKTKRKLYVIDEDEKGIYFTNYKNGKCLMKIDNRGNLLVSGKIMTGCKLPKRNIIKEKRKSKKC